MARVKVRLPTMLAQLVQSDREVSLEAETVGGVLEALFKRHPELAVHVLDETRMVRRHVSCFHNEAIVPREGMDRPIEDGDTVTIMQAVSGGRLHYSTDSGTVGFVGIRRM